MLILPNRLRLEAELKKEEEEEQRKEEERQRRKEKEKVCSPELNSGRLIDSSVALGKEGRVKKRWQAFDQEAEGRLETSGNPETGSTGQW